MDLYACTHARSARSTRNEPEQKSRCVTDSVTEVRAFTCKKVGPKKSDAKGGKSREEACVTDPREHLVVFTRDRLEFGPIESGSSCSIGTRRGSR